MAAQPPNVAALAGRLVAAINNGTTHIGFAHMSDRALPEDMFCVVNNFAAGAVDQPFAAAAIAAGQEAQVATEYATAITLNAHILAALQPAVPATFRALCLASRGAISMFGLCHRDAATGAWREVAGPAAGANIDALYGANQQLVDAAAAVPLANSLLGPVIAVVNWFNTNHHTVGTRLPHPQLRILCQIAGRDAPERGSRAHEEFTSLFRIAVHPVGAPEVLTNILNINCAAASGVIAGSRALPSVALDSWLDVRIPRYPAGTHKLSIFRSSMAILAEDGIAAFCKAWRHCGAANQAAAAIRLNPARFHIGSHYLTGLARDNTQDAVLQGCEPGLSDIAYYLEQAERGATLLQSPLMRGALREGASAPWRGIVAQWLQAGAQALGIQQLGEAAAEMAQAAGVAGVQPDPANPGGYAAAMQAAAVALRG